MTKSQIKAELRRSAMEDADPAYNCDEDAFDAALVFKESPMQRICNMKRDDCRMFFLLIAEAL